VNDATAASGISREELDDGQLWVLTLDTPPANILDARKIQVLIDTFHLARETRSLKAILFQATGSHFSFGASVEEHLPGACESMIPAFHELFRGMLAAEVVCLAAVNGRCLGGALELVTPCMRIWASGGASFGQPEINLGVFAPVASLLLGDRVGRARAEELCVSGRIVDAADAHRIGLVDELTDDPSAAALAYARTQLLPKSASSLRLAIRAARLERRAALAEALDAVERLYLETLMSTADAVEGLNAFVGKRQPVWRNQ
jgi:cyclohexa-1,5-dienecarbonyl-CoA hydratase